MAKKKKQQEKKEKPKEDSAKKKEESKEISKEQLNQEIEELTDLLKRTQADFINYKNRVEKETKNLLEYARREVIRNILPILDSFELALKNSKNLEKFKEGMEMIFAQMFDVLEKEGVTPIDAVGKEFDPYKHEVLLRVKSDQEEDRILEELQKGYMYRGKVLRHSKVKVSGGK